MLAAALRLLDVMDLRRVYGLLYVARMPFVPWCCLLVSISYKSEAGKAFRMWMRVRQLSMS